MDEREVDTAEPRRPRGHEAQRVVLPRLPYGIARGRRFHEPHAPALAVARVRGRARLLAVLTARRRSARRGGSSGASTVAASTFLDRGIAARTLACAILLGRARAVRRVAVPRVAAVTSRGARARFVAPRRAISRRTTCSSGV